MIQHTVAVCACVWRTSTAISWACRRPNKAKLGTLTWATYILWNQYRKNIVTKKFLIIIRHDSFSIIYIFIIWNEWSVYWRCRVLAQATKLIYFQTFIFYLPFPRYEDYTTYIKSNPNIHTWRKRFLWVRKPDAT